MALPLLAKVIGLGGGGGGGSSKGRITIEGWQELQRQISRAVDGDLPKEIGKVHKDVGRLIISHLHPPSVGSGRGQSVRPSASRRELILRTGFAGRDGRVFQWGADQEWPGGTAPSRPDIIGTARQHEAEITDALFDGIERALKPPFR